MANRVLLVLAHPTLETSHVNKKLLAAAKDIPGVTLHDLYARYPEQLIDMHAEQALVEQHDVLLFQHPLYWYSCPPLLKNWLDTVLSYGWAYGDEQSSLADKFWVHAISTGGSDSVYQRHGYNQFTLAELLRPFEQAARLCQIAYLQPFLTQAADTLSDEYLQRQAEAYAVWLQRLVAGELPPRVDSLQAEAAQYLAPLPEEG